jgi:hypothetical protein
MAAVFDMHMVSLEDISDNAFEAVETNGECKSVFVCNKPDLLD